MTACALAAPRDRHRRARAAGAMSGAGNAAGGGRGGYVRFVRQNGLRLQPT
eukprot:CAMPEP_0179345232 /NCGR_PEP_ID=MMETSP0797-20121207/71932_1 /TAXON_ID=47934 /ORGANISM="Dinophysis acuminata, Strain DAEP01" /LENGTH=50 /DNA_ID=CAMNT_0021059703 /DNA_START=26 /DNA_END=174 /DNA_ORIENTATION=-